MRKSGRGAYFLFRSVIFKDFYFYYLKKALGVGESKVGFYVGAVGLCLELFSAQSDMCTAPGLRLRGSAS